MKMHKGWIMILVMALLLSGCQGNPAGAEDQESTAIYEWMAGESPVPNRRIGTKRMGITNVDCAVSPTGIYIIPEVYVDLDEGRRGLAEGFYILYADHSSDTFRKLCGRSDCTHDTEDCNAWLYRGNGLSYYQGKLYAFTGGGAFNDEHKLIRMEPDGSRHKEIFDFQEFATEQGAAFAQAEMMVDGYCEFHLYTWHEEADGGMTDEWMKTYIYKLDGSWKEPRPLDAVGDPICQCGDMILALSGGPVEYKCWSMDLEEVTSTCLTDWSDSDIWYTDQQSYLFENGVFLYRDHDSGGEEFLADTGLKGNYRAFAFPDCILVASRDEGESADNNLYIYNWSYELVDAVELDFDYKYSASRTVMEETAERILLTDISSSSCIPLYYIEKSELGTGNVQLHEYQYE